MPAAMTYNGTKYYLHYDQVGSLRAVSNSSGYIIKEVVYDTFGNILSDSNETLKVPFGFASGLCDADTKLTRFGHRDYDAYTGKWTAKDPIGFDGGDSNLYGYVLGDPVSFVDPTGLKKGGLWEWFFGEAADDISDDALKKSYCGAMKKGSRACDKVKDGFREICAHPMSPCHASWISYWGSCKLKTLKCEEETCQK